ncbi:MAG: hypothetical protein RBS40_11160 [Rhodocyclaceae bacterium]|jgi:hypothetical protein|nr:hypothetical protein [Rhodocyclaceae bacterium]
MEETPKIASPAGTASLGRHLLWVVALKIAALALLWWFFVRDAAVPVNAQVAAQQIASPREAKEPQHD